MNDTSNTVAAGFVYVTPTDHRDLFRVNPDLPASAALARAADLAGSSRALARAAMDDGLDAPTCFLVEFAAAAINALCVSAGAP